VSKTLTIAFATAGTAAADLMHRVRNFSEDLDRGLRAGGLGLVLNPDSARDVVSVRVDHARFMGEAVVLAWSEARRHHLEQGASFERHS
jgi:hypothetical protein